MEINRNNYEAYLLDQLEGRLSSEGQQQLRNFLTLNPDCDPGLEEEDLWTLSPDTILFPGKSALKKEITDTGQPLTGFHFDLLSIARMEGDLSAAQVLEHEQMVEEDPNLQREWEEWQRTRLPDIPVEYYGKAQLKKPSGRVKQLPWIAIISSAAALALVLLLLTLRPIPSAQISQETGSSVSAEEQEQKVSPQVPMPSQDQPRTEVSMPIQDQPRTEDPISSQDQHRAEDLAATTDQASGNTHPGNVLHEGDALARLQTEIMDKNPAEHTALPNEELVMESPQNARIALNTIPAPVREGIPDRIRPMQLPPGQVHTRNIKMNDLAEMDLQEVVEDYAEEKNLSLFSIASAGIKGINRITGSQLKLYAAKDEEGEISGFQFKSKRIKITTPLQKQE